MKLFRCTCGAIVFFENSLCARSGHRLAFLPDTLSLTAVAPVPGQLEQLAVVSGRSEGALYRPCANGTAHAGCNWAIPISDPARFCRSCRLNEMVPDLSNEGDKRAWLAMEVAKRRLVFTLLDLGLPLRSRAEDPERGLGFVFAREQEGQPVLTGHAHGVITLNVAEADAPFREKLRTELGEAYRTLLGHFRHEIGHYYWDLLVSREAALPAFRELFGDETADYQGALARHYEGGPVEGWHERHVSAYASSHPWEDWAETWAHYLHMVDTLDTARSHGLVLRAPGVEEEGRSVRISVPAVDFEDFDALLGAWIPLTVALNDLSRSMGLPDAYPFVLPETVSRKLRFVHGVVERAAAEGASREREREGGVTPPSA